MVTTPPVVVPITEYENQNVDLSDSDKEDYVDEVIDKLHIRNKKLSRLNKGMTQYDNMSGMGVGNQLASAILRYLYQLYIELNLDFYSVVFVFKDREHFLHSLKETTGYKKTVNEQSFCTAKRKLRDFRCIRASDDNSTPLKLKGYEGKFLIQLKSLKFD